MNVSFLHPPEIEEFLKRDILINSLNYYEVKKWASQQKEVGGDKITYLKVIERCREYEATVRDYIAMKSDNSHLQTAYQEGEHSATVEHNAFRRKQNRGRKQQRFRSNSGSRERNPKHKGTKCKRCGFEKHTTSDGSCPALNSTCGYCEKSGHYESACITKKIHSSRKGQKGQRHNSKSPPRYKRSSTPGPKKTTVKANTLAVKATQQLQEDFHRIHFDCIKCIPEYNQPDQPDLHLDAITMLDTDREGKTYVLTTLDVQLPHRTGRDTLQVKVDMGAEANILPLRTFKKMFPHLILEYGTPKQQKLQHTNLQFQCNKNSVIRSSGCITLHIAQPGQKMIAAQFFISAHHDQVLLGHPSSDQLHLYQLNLNNQAPVFDQAQLLPQLDTITPGSTPVTSVKQLQQTYPECF